MLWVHIAGGTSALLTGLGAMLTTKGGKTHRMFGKVYFWSMTVVFVTALVMSIGHQRAFLFMVAFFSYYFTVRGYRVLHLKGLGRTQEANWIDWLIGTVSGVFIAFLLGWGVYTLSAGDMMGLVALVFGGVGSTFLLKDIQTFRSVPERKHWWYGHIASMGGSYISAFTAFVVVNVTIPGFGWVLWILPSVIGSVLISRTIRKYKMRFEAAG